MMNMIPAGKSPALNVSDDQSEDLTRIGDMSRLFGVTLRALRFYEDKGLINPVRQGTTRLYTRRDKARLKLILLGRKVGFSLREVKQMLDLYDPKGTNAKQLRVALEKSERQLGRLERQRQTLEDAMNDLQDLIAEIRGGLDGRQRVAAGGR
jgi:DNA-binding transcriptional MerR regulator